MFISLTAIRCIAKLARLMSSELPLLIDPARLAASGKRVAGDFTLTEMPRLVGLVQNQEGKVTYNLAFEKDDHGVIRISGKVSARLTLVCQRCLNLMEWQLNNPVNIGFAGDREQIEYLPDFVEPLISELREIPLASLIEEEVILGLPLSPLHNPEDCPAQQLVEQHSPKRDNPFAILKDVRSKK